MAWQSQNYMVRVDMTTLQLYLRKYKITQLDMAEYLGVSLRTYGYWRRNNKIPAGAFLKVCDLFGWLNLPDHIDLEFKDV